MQLLTNPSFEAPLSPFQWVDTSIGGATAVRTQGNPANAPKAHTGEFFARLTAKAGQTAQLTQTFLALLLPGANLRLAFFARKLPPHLRRHPDAPTTVTATVDLTLFGVTPLPGFLTIVIPPAANPTPGCAGAYEYYEAFSLPLPYGVTGASVSITVDGTPVKAIWDFDDITLNYSKF